MALRIPSSPSYKRKAYTELKGADFSVDPSLVDSRHSPDLLNMVSDNGGNPVKRKGWEIVHSLPSKITNMWVVGDSMVVSSGNSFYRINNNQIVDQYPVTRPGKKLGFISQTAIHSGLFILDGEKYFKITESSCTEVKPYVPLVIISRSPTGGGVVYEGINILTRERKEQFLNNGATTFLVTSQVDTTRPYKFEYKNSDGEWVAVVPTVNGATFTVGSVYSPPVIGQDNISITYYATGTGNPNIDKSDRILGCEVNSHYSSTISSQVFVSGNPKYPQYVYYSGLGDPTYFPDLNYLTVGGASTSVMGFLNLGEYLAVVKEQSGQDPTTALIYQTSISTKTVTVDSKTAQTTQELTYAIKQSTTGIGAVSKSCFNVLNDEPLFLSASGIFGIVSTSLTSEKVTRNRSYYLDQKLTREPNLENAVACVWQNYYILAVNNHAYVLDGRHKGGDRRGNTSYVYEGYYWDNIPATCFLVRGKELWFGTSDGKICRFKDTGQITDYSDNGTAIKSIWSTPSDNDGVTEYFKTMTKKGTMCTLAPYEKSSVNIYIEADSGNREFIGQSNIDIWSGFNSVDFTRFAFDTRTGPRDKFFNKKKKRYKRLKIILENNAVNEPFGVFEIIKTYTVDKFAK